MEYRNEVKLDKEAEGLESLARVIAEENPVFPATLPHSQGGVCFVGGLNKREMFAAMAMQGFVMDGTESPEGVARLSVKMADALLAELSPMPEVPHAQST